MERYNMLFSKPSQAALATDAPVNASKAARWPDAPPGSHPSAASVGAATLLHVALCALLLTVVRLPVTPKVPESPTVELAFAPPQPASLAPVAPIATPAPPVPADEPTPPDAPVAENPPPATPQSVSPTPAATPDPPVSADMPTPPAAPAAETVPPPPPPPSTPAAKSSNVAPPVARPSVVHKAAPLVRPVPQPHIAETPIASQAQRPDMPASQPAATPPAAVEAPIPSDWQRSLAAWLAAHKTYPDEARRRGTEGIVVLRFTTDRSGHVLDVALVRSSGALILDAAAEAMVRQRTLPPFTVGMPQNRITITVQIRYALTN